MNLSKMVSQAQEAMTVRRVYGEPFVKNGVTVIPAASIRGAVGGGGGDDKSGEHEQTGSGCGLMIKAAPIGAFVIQVDKVSWRPSYDINRVMLGVLGAQLTVIVALIVQSRQKGPGLGAATAKKLKPTTPKSKTLRGRVNKAVRR